MGEIRALQVRILQIDLAQVGTLENGAFEMPMFPADRMLDVTTTSSASKLSAFADAPRAPWRPLWAALEHPDKYPLVIMLADTRGQASINYSTVQHELRDNELILKDYGHLKYRRINDPRPEPTLRSMMTRWMRWCI